MKHILKQALKLASVVPVALLLARPAAAQQPVTPPAAPAGEVPVDRVIAVVGDQPILWSQVQEVIYQRRAQGMPIPTDSAEAMALARQVVSDLIDEEVLLAKAKSEKVELTDDEVRATVDREVKRIRDRFKTESEYRQALLENGFGTPEEYRKSLTDQARRSALQQRVLDKLRQDGKISAAAVSEADVNEAFEKNRATLPKRPATVGFRQVVIATKPSAAAKERARVKAESLLAEIKRGGDFEQIAKRESMDPGTKDVGGDLGWLRRGATVPEFERWLFALQPGQISPVFESGYGYHVLKVERVQPAEVKSRHILISPATDSADLARAHAEADSVAAQWRAGVAYDSLVAKHHDVAGGEEKSLPQFERAQLPESYQKAFEGKAVNDIVGPFEIANPRGAPKLVVAQLTAVQEGGEYTVSDLKQTIRDQLVQERGIRRYLDAQRKEMYVSIQLDEVMTAARPTQR